MFFDSDNNNNNSLGYNGIQTQKQQDPEEYILKIQITNITRAQLRLVSRDESNVNENVFALRGNLGRDSRHEIGAQLHGTLSDSNNNMQHGTISCTSKCCIY